MVELVARFKAELLRHAGDPVVVLGGEIDVAVADQLRRALHMAVDVAEPHSTVVVDMSLVTFTDCTGINALVYAHRKMEAKSGRLTLRSPSQATSRLLEATGVARVFAIVD